MSMSTALLTHNLRFFPHFQANFLLSATEHSNQDKYDLSHMVNKYQLLVYLADSLFDDEQYKRAEVCKLK